ncbi:MAG: hypothetical protein U0872_12635 [Planctomycetaceae bacterium]
MDSTDSRGNRHFRNVFTFLLAVTALVQGGIRLGQAQDPEESPTFTRGDLRFQLVKSSNKGGYTYVPGQWGELQLRIDNVRQEPCDLLCATSFDVKPTLQFGRRIWLPPRSRLTISHPALIPEADQFKDLVAKIHSLVIENPDGGEVLVQNDTGQLLHDQLLPLAPAVRNTGIIVGAGVNDQAPEDVMHFVSACRKQQTLAGRMTVLGDHFLPTDETNLKYLDHLVVTENRLLDDVAALAAVRRWLHAGGRLWIMLDRADPRVLEALFGDDFRCHVVDQVELTSIKIDNPFLLAEPQGEDAQALVYDEPVTMTRLIVPEIAGMKVWRTVNGWPAAITKTYGEGRLLITTLGARGWMKPKPPSKGEWIELPPLSEFILRGTMEDIANQILEQRPPELLAQQDLQPLAREQIAYQVPSWGLIVGTLFCFIASLITIGIFLLRLERLEHLGWSGAALSVLFGAALMMVGWSNRRAAPESEASVQFAQGVSGTNDVRTRGMIAVYHPEGSDARVQVTRGGDLWPDMTGQENSLRRMVMTDLGKFYWDGLTQPPGLRISPFTASRSTADRIGAQATFDATGLVGNYTGQIVPEGDSLVATRQGRIGVELRGDGAFSASAANTFEADQYLQASFVNDDQDRRRRLLQRLFENSRRSTFPAAPQLMLWVKNWENGFDFGENLQRKGEALLSVPLTLSRPTTDDEFVIPAAFLSFRTRQSPDGSAPSGIWNTMREEWQERSSFGSNWLRFQVPPELLPISSTRATVQVKASGPMGRLEILGLKGDAIQSVQVVTDPVGTITIDITDADLLQISPDGGLSLGVNAGIPTPDAAPGPDGAAPTPSTNAQMKANYWRIESLSLQLWATTSKADE